MKTIAVKVQKRINHYYNFVLDYFFSTFVENNNHYEPSRNDKKDRYGGIRRHRSGHPCCRKF